VALAEFDRTGRISWTSDLADIPAEYGVSNVYGDVGSCSPRRWCRSRACAPRSWASWSKGSAPIT
jgi:hypothetical protein